MLEIKNLKIHFPVTRGLFRRSVGYVHAVDGVSLKIESGRTLGLVGESGCGKTTLGRSITGLYKPTEGKVIFKGKNIFEANRKELWKIRRDLQMIFQDPFESLNPRQTIDNILEEPFIIHNAGAAAQRREKVKDVLRKVGMPQSSLPRFPHEFSGGQRQRIGIARAIALKPKMIVCDEPVSALDVSIQSQILNLLLTLQQEMNLTYLFISHDLAVVRHISDNIGVMYLGKIVEYCDADELYNNGLHPYTKALISAIPVPNPDVIRKKQLLQGEAPSPIDPPSGCRFHTRCPKAGDICKKKEPELLNLKTTGINGPHFVACHLAGE
jgi:oligopeptide/dipeptide ABC transporter ATP-binding protein